MEKSISNAKIARDSFSESIWQAHVQKNEISQRQFEGNETFDVLVVGAGITGITAALLLQQAGKKCVVADSHAVAFGTTGGTSAHLNTFFDATYPEIDSDFGSDASKLVSKAGSEALNLIKNFISKYQIDCDFEEKDGYLFSQNEQETKTLKDILASSLEANVAAEEVNQNGVPLPFESVLKFKRQAQFHPTKYILRLAEEFLKLGGIILEHTRIHQTKFENNIHTATAENISITAKNVVYATHIPPGINLLSLRCAPYRSYVIAATLADEKYPDCLAYDMKEPYHYFRTHEIEGQKYLLLGGEDHKTGHEDPTAAFENLINYAKTYFNIKDISFQWSSQYYVPVDGLPYIGLMPGGDDNLYVATGFNGNGMQFGTISAKIIADLIQGIKSEYADLFKPSRIKPIAGFTEFIRENADVAYHFVADRLSGEAIDSLKELKPDEGKVVDFDNQKLAVYKSTSGEIKALNPVCSHAKCIVNFNNEEKSWDCPCHGGRFDLDGKVLTGPPREDLQQIKID